MLDPGHAKTADVTLSGASMLDQEIRPLTLVGRDHELDLLRVRIDALISDRRSATVILRGRRGSGLSALLEAAVADAGAAGARVAVATCSPAESRLPFGMVLQLAASLGETDDPEDSGGAGGDALTRPLRASSPAASRSTVATVAGLCAGFLEVARRRPLLIAVDDVHWADPLSLAWLRAMESRMNQAPLLLLRATARQLPDPGAVESLPVRPLPELDMGRLARAWCGEAAENAFVANVAAEAGGCPAVLRAMVNRLSRQGAAPAEDPSAIADSAAQVVAQRAGRALDGLSADALRLARAMAVCGRAGGFELATVLAAPLDESWQTALDDLVSLGLARIEGTPALAGEGVAAQVLGTMAAADRSVLARRAAELGHQSALADDRLAELVMRAQPMSPRWVEEVLCRVAARRRTDGDARSAAALLMRALRSDAPARRPRLLIELALAEVSGRPQASDLRLQEVLSDAAPHATLGELVQAADLLQCRGDARTAHRAIAMACQRIPGPDANALAAIGWLAAQDSDTEQLLPVPPLPELDEPLVDRARDPAADPIVEPIVAGVVAWRLAAQGRRRDQVRVLAATVLDSAGTSLPFLPRIRACRALLLAGDAAAALRGLDRVLLDARQAGAGMPAALARIERARCELTRGMPGRAAGELAAARRELPPDSWHPRLLPWLVALEACGHLVAGEVEAAERVLGTDLPPAAADGAAWAHLEYARGGLRMALADPAAALPHFLACGRALMSRGMANPAISDWRSMAALAHAAHGERADAAALVQVAADRARIWGEPLTTARVHLLAVRSGCGAITRDLVEAAPPPEGGDRDAAEHAGRYDSGYDGGRQRTGRAPTDEAPPLSADDERVARLAAAGWSNADIARFLSVSTRTVEARLTAIYRRLELTGRKQLAELFPPTGHADPRFDAEA